jgi:uncharacterized protein (TIGR00369 family)
MKFQPKNKDYRKIIEEVLSGQYFMKHVGIEMETCNPGSVLLKLKLEENHMQQAYFVHGGVTSTLADIAMGFSALTLVEKGKGMVTADLHISYHRPGEGEFIWVEAWVTKPGNTLFFCEARIYTTNDKGEET